MRRTLKTNRRTFGRHLGIGFERLESRLLLHAGSHGDSDVSVEADVPDDAVADFSLIDANPASSTYNQPVSPRDYLGQVSVWMFGYST